MAKILIIHNLDTLDIFSTLLKDIIPQCRLITASSGPEGMEKAVSEHPDVILVDTSVHGMDGFEICKQIKTEEALRYIPVVLLMDREADENNPLEQTGFGADAFLRKPINKTELITQVFAMLRIKESEDLLRREKDLLEDLIRERTRALKVCEARYKGIFENTINAVAVYLAVDDGEGFILVDFNRAGESIERVHRDDIIGKRVTDVFPGVKSFGLFDVFQRVWKTGNPEHFPVAMYQDDRISGWRDNFVHKLPSGEIVAIYSDETERKQYEQKLRESEEMYRMLFEHAGFGIALVDPNTGRREAFNRNLYERLGYTYEECKNLTITDIQYEDGPEAVQDRMRMILEKGSLTFEEKHRTKNDDARHILVSAVPICIHGKQFIQTISLDITDRKKAETALQESEKRFRQLAENIQEVFWVVSPDWLRIHYISPAYENVWGRTCESLYKNPQSWLDAVVVEDRDLVTGYLKKKMNKDLSEIAFPEYRITRPDGSIRWILARGFAISNEAGGVDRIVGIAKDITDRKESEKAFQAILESTVGIIGQGFFNKILHETCNWLNCEIAFIVEIDNDMVCHPVAVIVDGHISPASSFKLTGTPCHGVFLNGFRFYPEGIQGRFPDDQRLPEMGAMGYVGTSLIDGAGNKIGVLGAVSRKKLSLPERAEDVMKILAARVSAELERKKVEREKIRVEAQLQQAQKMEAIGTLAGGIAHDFNNILQSIILNTELAIYERRSIEGTGRMEEVLKASKRAADLVKQILTFSRRGELELKPLHIGIIIEEALRLLRSSLPTTIEIRKKLNSKSDLVMADVTQIHQVIMNLCSNAGHAMKAKGGVLNVTLSPEDIGSETSSFHPDLHQGPYLKLVVSDTGNGMDPVTLRRIFDPFFTTKERGEGTGLGLSVVYGIVKNLGGAITAESEEGKGTTFSIFFPRLEKEGKKMVEKIGPIPKGKERILLIDDEDDLIDVERGVLEKLGYQTVTTSDSMKGLDIFRSQPEGFDLVITDQTMPKIPGSELAKELIRIRPDIPIILCTGHSAMISEDQARSLGIRALAMKPFEMREIAETIRKVLDKKND
ncbi:MAG: PAS domain S-box protein [Deltaproteobacteria bacterium]|nr:PAS domain S-box protein [Deltaproteobacteria bacterium]